MDARRYLRHDGRDRIDEKTGRRDLSVYGQNDQNKNKNKNKSKKETSESALKVWWHRVLVSLKLLAAGIVLGGLAWSLPVFWGWLDRPIAKVEVGGSFRYLDKNSVAEQLKPYMQTTFFDLDLREVQQQLQNDSWVSAVQIRKVWPDVVEVVLEEEVPVARWLDRELITADGDILRSRQGRAFTEFPALGGPTGREQEVMQQYLTLSQQLRPLKLKVAGLNLTPAGHWSFQIGEVDIKLGGEELIGRMQRFSRLYFGQLESEWAKVKSVDLRYRDGIAVAWLQAGK